MRKRSVGLSGGPDSNPILSGTPIIIEVPPPETSGVIAVPNSLTGWNGVWIDLSEVEGTSLPISVQFDVWIPQSLIDHFLSTPSTAWLEWAANFEGNIDGIRYWNRNWNLTYPSYVDTVYRWTTINTDNWRIDSVLGSGWNAYPEVVCNTWTTFYWEVTPGPPSHTITKMNGQTITDYFYDGIMEYPPQGEYDFGMIGSTGGGANASDIVYLRNIEIHTGSFSFGPASSIEDFQGNSWSGIGNVYNDPGPSQEV